MTLAVALLFAALTTSRPMVPAEAAPAPEGRTPVFLHTDAPDSVGAACVARLREALQRSGGYRTVADPTGARFIVGIVTMDPNEAEAGAVAGLSTVAAVTLQRENAAGLNHYVYSWVLVARRDKVDAVVADILAAIDREIRELEGPAPRVASVPGR